MDQKSKLVDNSNDNTINRRKFLAGAAAAAAFTIVPRHVLGGPGFKAPSEKLNIAAIGCGGKATSNLSGCKGENIVALCDVDWARGKWGFDTFPKAAKYKDYRVMLEEQKDNIDAVIVTTPDHTHAVATMAAIKAGKHVYCEKPLTHTIHEARVITQAAKKAGVATQMGNQGRSGSGIRVIKEYYLAGAIGEIKEIHCWTNRPIDVWPQGINRPKEVHKVPDTLNWDLWQSCAPHRPYNSAYAPFNWRGWWDYGCGALGDMGCHIIDVPYWALDLTSPTKVSAISTPVFKETGPLVSMVTYDFPAEGKRPAVQMKWYDGKMMPTCPPEIKFLSDNGVLMVGDKGTLLCGCYGANPKLYLKDGKDFGKPKELFERTNGHYDDWIKACKGGKAASSNFDYAGPMTETVLLGNLAVRSGKALDWDAKNLKVTNYEDANQYVSKAYLNGFTL
ncbi:MAG: Gfo/Idh/MocA family oxidoreductase [Phycisphaerae bacterium]|nr:Gfo/Idh/MocA family oxidoreductase [Phycisphaerae bacterium]